MELKINLAKIKEKRKLSVLEMTKEMGLTVGYGEYSKFASGSRVPRLDKALLIAKNLGLKVEEIWTLEK